MSLKYGKAAIGAQSLAIKFETGLDLIELRGRTVGPCRYVFFFDGVKSIRDKVI